MLMRPSTDRRVPELVSQGLFGEHLMPSGTRKELIAGRSDFDQVGRIDPGKPEHGDDLLQHACQSGALCRRNAFLAQPPDIVRLTLSPRPRGFKLFQDLKAFENGVRSNGETLRLIPIGVISDVSRDKPHPSAWKGNGGLKEFE